MNRQKEIREQALTQSHKLALRIERAMAPANDDAATDNRTVELSFASDEPHEHFLWATWEYVDIALSMDAKAVRSERLQNGAALLMDHNTSDQIGVIESFSLDKKEGKARATVRFSKSQRGEEIYQDVLDGIRQNVSVGFMIHKLTLVEQRDRSKGEIDLYSADDWEPFEISIVSVPADISVGVGRSLDDNGNGGSPAPAIIQKPLETNNMSTNETPVPPVETRSADLIAADNVAEWGRVMRKDDIAADYILDAKLAGEKPTQEGFFARVKAAQSEVKIPQMDPQTAAERAGVQTQAVSIARHGRLRNFKGEGAETRALRFGYWALATLGNNERAAKFCRENGITMIRAQVESVNEKGGYLVPEEFGNDLIDLREQYGVFRRNAKIVPMASETRSDPRRVGGLTAYFKAEEAVLTLSDKNWDRVNLTAKKITALARVSNEVSEDAIINFGDDLAYEVAYAFAQKEDDCGFNGDGTDTYGNIVGVTNKLLNQDATIANIAGLQVASGNAYSEIVLADFEALVAKLPVYADTPRAKFYCHKAFYWNVMVKAILAAGGVTGAEIEGARSKRFLGYDVEFVQVMPKTEANSQVCTLFGDLYLAASFGSRRDTTIALSDQERFSYDEWVLRGTERFDINVHDVGNASGTASLRVPGPIVGLITAAS